MRLKRRRCAALGFVAFLQAVTWACGSHGTAVGVPIPVPGPVPPQPDRPSDPPSTGAVSAEPPAAPAPTPATPPPQPTNAVDECTLIAAPGDPVVTVGLQQRIDRLHAPYPTNESERLLFRQLYETLVRVDCIGRVSAGLASSWRLDDEGRAWIVTLRQDARFSDGSPVTAADVRASWTDGGADGELRPHVSRLIESVVPVGERNLAITLRHPSAAAAPLALAHADLAVATTVAGSAWPLGTRSGRIALDGDTKGTHGASVMTITRDDAPALRLLIAPGDPRDLLDQDVDLLLTRDSSALAYAATLPQFQSMPMAWQRVHVLLAPGGSRSSPSMSDDARQALASDAIRGEARGARGPFWWEMSSACRVASPSAATPSSIVPRVVYDASDDAARDLAERFVGLGTYQRAAGLRGDALAAAHWRGLYAGYVVGVESRPVDPCRELQTLVDAAPWLDPATIVPLVETRVQAVVRRGRTGITVEWDGGVVIAGANAVNNPGPR